MPIIFDYQNSESKRELLRPGEYEVEIISAELGVSSNGNDQLKVALQPEGSTTVIRDYIPFSAKAKWKVRQFLDCFDLAPDEEEDATQMEIDDEFVEDLVGKVGNVKIGTESYNGIKRNRIFEYLPFDAEEQENDE